MKEFIETYKYVQSTKQPHYVIDIYNWIVGDRYQSLIRLLEKINLAVKFVVIDKKLYCSFSGNSEDCLDMQNSVYKVA